jgi:hypothetical protein
MDAKGKSQRWIQMVRSVFFKEGGWRQATSLYLIGGFARDEGTARLVNGQLHINDLDFLVIVPRKDPLRMLALSRILRILNDGRFGCQIDLVIASRRELLDPRASILNYDVQQSHAWLWGEKFFSSTSYRRLDAHRILQSDALQLLLNRQASLMIAFSLLQEGKFEVHYLQVQLAKPLAAMMAAIQIAEQSYTLPIREQLAWIEAGRQEQSSKRLWKVFRDDRLLHLLQQTTEFKHEPQPKHFEPYETNIDTIARSYHLFLQAFLAHHYKQPEETDISDLVATMRSHQPTQIDLCAPSWWASRLRAHQQGVRTRPPGIGPHPQVDVYAAQLMWMSRHLRGSGDDWRKWIPWLKVEEDTNELSSLIGAWKASGYDCRLS